MRDKWRYEEARDRDDIRDRMSGKVDNKILKRFRHV